MSVRLAPLPQMKIKLQEPYFSAYKAGYYFPNNGDERAHVILVTFNGGTTTTSYARYILACSIGRFLTENEEADHKDENKGNDELNNLQILSRLKNIHKHCEIRGKKRKKIRLICPNCLNEFVIFLNVSFLQKSHGRYNVCSRKCNHIMNSKRLSIQEMIEIGKNQIIEIFQ